MRYGGPPPPDLPWPIFLALAARCGRYSARELYDRMTAQLFGAGVQHDDSGASQTMYDDVRHRAWPDLPSGPTFVPLRSAEESL